MKSERVNTPIRAYSCSFVAQSLIRVHLTSASSVESCPSAFICGCIFFERQITKARTMSEKFIPPADRHFEEMSRNFANNIANQPERFMLSADDSATITRAVHEF